MRHFIIAFLLMASAAGDARAMTPVTVSFKGKEYTFQYELYDEPMVLDFKTPPNDRSTPLGTLKTFLYAKSHLEHYDRLPEYHRQANGELVPPVPEEHKQKYIQMSKSLLTHLSPN